MSVFFFIFINIKQLWSLTDTDFFGPILILGTKSFSVSIYCIFWPIFLYSQNIYINTLFAIISQVCSSTCVMESGYFKLDDKLYCPT